MRMRWHVHGVDRIRIFGGRGNSAAGSGRTLAINSLRVWLCGRSQISFYCYDYVLVVIIFRLHCYYNFVVSYFYQFELSL